MDKTDEALLALLVEDARLPVAQIAARLDLARSTVQSRIERLERRGIIGGYTIRLGQKARSARIRATVLLQVEPRASNAVLQRLKAMPAVERAHTASGRFDMILTVAAADPAALDTMLDEIGEMAGVNDTESLIQLSTRIDRGV